VDLSLTLDEQLPCTWPGHTAYRHTVDSWFEGGWRPDGADSAAQRGYYTGSLVIDEHTGTHVDAPIHSLSPGDAQRAAADAVDRIPLEQLIGRARVLDVRKLDGTAQEGTSPLITSLHVSEHEQAYGPLLEGEIVLLCTGWDSRYLPGPAGAEYSQQPRVQRRGVGWPAPDVGCVEMLVERGVRCIGTDAPTVGPLQDPVPTHRAGLGAGVVFVEGLTRLERLPARGATFVCLPLKISGGSGSPARALAVLPSTEYLA
jgi:kynurenine formamidase